MTDVERYPLVCICVVNWNNYADTSECLDSLRLVEYPKYRVVVVDNASTDSSGERLVRGYPWAAHICNDANLGFAGGNNVGIRYALNMGAEYVFLLNNDAVLDSSAISELVEVAESDDELGIVGPAIYYYAEDDVFWCAAMEKCLPEGKIFPQYRMRGKGSRDHGQYDGVESVDMINGCALMIRRSVVEEVGLLDERFFLYNEDTDWNDRVAQAGYGIAYVPKAKVWHKGSVSTGGECSPESWFYTVRNELFFYAKRAGWLELPGIYADFVRENYWFWKGFRQKGDEAGSAAVLDGIWSGLIGRGGQRKKRAPWWFESILEWKMRHDGRQEEGVDSI